MIVLGLIHSEKWTLQLCLLEVSLLKAAESVFTPLSLSCDCRKWDRKTAALWDCCVWKAQLPISCVCVRVCVRLRVCVPALVFLSDVKALHEKRNFCTCWLGISFEIPQQSILLDVSCFRQAIKAAPFSATALRLYLFFGYSSPVAAGGGIMTRFHKDPVWNDSKPGNQ